MGVINRAHFLWMVLAMAAIMSHQAASLRAQGAAQDWEKAAGGTQEFEVASVRENKDDGPRSSNLVLDSPNAYYTVHKNDALAPAGTLFSAKNQTLMRYIVFAYKLSGMQELALRFDSYSGLKQRVPEWVKNDRYNIEARASGTATTDQMRLMMQGLLADRFNLVVHWETREAPVFALVLDKPGKPGPQLEPHPVTDDCTADRHGDPADGTASLAVLPIPCGIITRVSAAAQGGMHFAGRNVTLAMLADSLPTQTGLVTLPRPLIDKTGLEGRYNLMLAWTPEDTSEVNNRETGGTFLAALKDQLGLRLKPETAPVQILVIDRVEQPSPN